MAQDEGDVDDQVQRDFEAFFADEYPRLVRLAWTLCGRRAVAEELAQDALLEALRRWDDVSSLQRPDAWVRRVLMNKSTSAWRRVRLEQRFLGRSAARDRVEPQLAEPDAALWAAVRALPTRQRHVMALVALEQLTVVEAADALGIAEDTARTHLRRARTTVAAALHVEDDR